MAEVETRVVNDGGKNFTFSVTGILSKDVLLLDILDFNDLNSVPKKIRLESITFAIQEKAGFYLWWRGRDSNKSLILPLESRGFFDFEKVGCLHSPEGTRGLAISSFGVDKPKAFMLLIDLGKQ